jgi:hypothetical protein
LIGSGRDRASFDPVPTPDKSRREIAMQLSREDTAIVFIDPQNEVLSEKGSAWPLVRDSLHENNTIENMERIFKTAKEYGFEVFISLHYFYLLEASRHRIHCGCFQRKRLRFNQLET